MTGSSTRIIISGGRPTCRGWSGRCSRAFSGRMNRSGATIRSRNFLPTSPAPASPSRSMCRPTGPRSASRTRPPGCSGRRTRPAGRTRSSPTPISAPTTCGRSSTAWRATRWFAASGCNCTGTTTRYTVSRRARISRRSDAPAQRRASRRLWLELRSAGVRAADGGAARPCRGLPERHLRPAARRHAGGSFAGRPRGLARRHGAAGARARTSFAKLSGLGTFMHRNDPAHIADDRRRDRRRCSAPAAACSDRTSRSRNCGPAIARLSTPIATPRRVRAEERRRSCTIPR